MIVPAITMGFTKLDSLLPRSVKRFGIGKKLANAQALDAFLHLAVDWFGADALKRLKPLGVKNGALMVACLSSVLEQQLKDRESQICKELSRRAPDSRIDRIQIIG